jgi:hypothetical protein
MDLCVIDIFYFLFLIQMDHEAMNMLTILIF